MLEAGRNLRKSKVPIECRVRLNRVWKTPKVAIENTEQNKQRYVEEGTLPPEIPVKVTSPYSQHWQEYNAIIPVGGITDTGYVKDVLVECYSLDFTDDMTPEEKEKFNKTFEMLRTEDEYEIHAWRASGGEDPYILFQGTKEACETEYAKLKRILTTSES